MNDARVFADFSPSCVASRLAVGARTITVRPGTTIWTRQTSVARNFDASQRIAFDFKNGIVFVSCARPIRHARTIAEMARDVETGNTLLPFDLVQQIPETPEGLFLRRRRLFHALSKTQQLTSGRIPLRERLVQQLNPCIDPRCLQIRTPHGERVRFRRYRRHRCFCQMQTIGGLFPARNGLQRSLRQRSHFGASVAKMTKRPLGFIGLFHARIHAVCMIFYR